MKKQPNDPEKTRAAERLFMALSGIDSKYLNECESQITPALSGVDESYLKEAEAQPEKKLLYFPKRAGTVVAAVLCAAVLGTGYYATQLVGRENRSADMAAEIVEEVQPESNATAVTTDSYAADAATAETDGQQDSENGAEAAESADTAENAETELLEQPDAAECDLTGALKESESKESAQTESEQADGTQNLQDELSTSVGAEKTQGNENTTADAPVDESTYEEAQSYPAEVEEIQAAISQAMADGELPFVTASGIYEDPVRIVVRVNTTDETLIEQVKAFDPSGEIIEIVYSDEAVQK